MCVQICSAEGCEKFKCNAATHYCRFLLAQVSLHYALFHCVALLPVILPVLSYFMSPAPLLDPFILVMYQVLLYKMQTSHVASDSLVSPLA